MDKESANRKSIERRQKVQVEPTDPAKHGRRQFLNRMVKAAYVAPAISLLPIRAASQVNSPPPPPGTQRRKKKPKKGDD